MWTDTWAVLQCLFRGLSREPGRDWNSQDSNRLSGSGWPVLQAGNGLPHHTTTQAPTMNFIKYLQAPAAKQHSGLGDPEGPSLVVRGRLTHNCVRCTRSVLRPTRQMDSQLARLCLSLPTTG